MASLVSCVSRGVVHHCFEPLEDELFSDHCASGSILFSCSSGGGVASRVIVSKK